MEKIRAEVKAAAVEGKLACTKAFELAKTLGCSVKDVGEAANAEKVKIVACQLGCF